MEKKITLNTTVVSNDFLKLDKSFIFKNSSKEVVNVKIIFKLYPLKITFKISKKKDLLT